MEIDLDELERKPALARVFSIMGPARPHLEARALLIIDQNEYFWYCSSHVMLKMRLQRIGRKNNPSYRVLVVDSRQGPKSGKYVDHLGSYDPKADRVQIDGDKAKHWIKNGVQVSPTVHNLLVGQKIIEGKKVNVLPKKSPVIDEEKLKAEAEALEAAKAEAEAPAEEASTDDSESTDAPAEESTPETEEAPAEEKVEEEKKEEPVAA